MTEKFLKLKITKEALEFIQNHRHTFHIFLDIVDISLEHRGIAEVGFNDLGLSKDQWFREKRKMIEFGLIEIIGTCRSPKKRKKNTSKTLLKPISSFLCDCIYFNREPLWEEKTQNTANPSDQTANPSANPSSKNREPLNGYKHSQNDEIMNMDREPLDEKPRTQPRTYLKNGNGLLNDKIYLYKENGKENDRSNEDSSSLSPSFSDQEKFTAFDPSTYILANGQPFSEQTQKALAKYSPENLAIYARNVLYYEKNAKHDELDSHEAWIQTAYKFDYAKKDEFIWQNKTYVSFYVVEHKLHNIDIKETLIVIKRKKDPLRISLKLHPTRFAELLELYTKNVDKT